ncbi:DUF4407 domain-containing protein [Actinomadura oligospora]|uniref:DUF4407 domain-containing protein n=1 Tax=Actinomadura oligospora TaxID=111804 RepID=UPI0004787098|nr:DUF4407 domain-containing protein [Actinomadura oligospora]
MKNVLVWLSGADPDILRRATTDRAKYIGIGGAVLTTASLASVSMFFALRMAVGASVWAAVPLSMLWFLVILNLDRWLVVSLTRSQGKVLTVLLALPRVAMALLFGVIISTPLVLQIFNDEVAVAVDKIHDEDSRKFQQNLDNGPDSQRIRVLEQQEAQLLRQRTGDGLANPEDDAEIKQLRAQLPALQKEFNDYDDKAACELTGDRCKGTSGRSGDGPRYQKFVRRRDQAKTQIDQINKRISTKSGALNQAAAKNKDVLVAQAQQKLPGVQSELKTLRGRQQSDRAAFEKNNKNNTGLLIRLKGLDRASEGESQLQSARLLLFLFITVLECLPIIVKVLSLFGPPGAYDEAVEKVRSRDRLLLDDQVRKQEGVGLRENSGQTDFARRLQERRNELVETSVAEIIEVERRLQRLELERWEREQLRRFSAESNGAGAGAGTAGAGAGTAGAGHGHVGNGHVPPTAPPGGLSRSRPPMPNGAGGPAFPPAGPPVIRTGTQPPPAWGQDGPNGAGGPTGDRVRPRGETRHYPSPMAEPARRGILGGLTRWLNRRDGR